MAPKDNLSPEERDALLRAIDRAIKKRRIHLVGYFLALVVILFGMVGALAVYGMAPRGMFVGWVFLVPLGLAGIILWLFGWWARKT